VFPGGLQSARAILHVNIMEHWLAEHALEWFGTATGLIYLYLEIRQKPAMWVLGLVTSLVYVVVFFRARFYADMGLNVYYVVISIYGFLLWTARGVGRKQSPAMSENGTGVPIALVVRRVRAILAVKLLLVSAALFGLMGYVLDAFTDSPVPYYDALTTALSITATWMLARKYLDHWFVWFFVNFFSVYLYLWRGLYPTALLFFFYGAMTIVGYREWKKSYMSTHSS
jgi:nicotinamide mononucleotide transporter